MFRHILVPIDLSGRNARTLQTALGLAVQSRARVTLLHVVEPVASVPVAELRRFYERLERTSQQKLARAAGRFVRNGVPVQTAVFLGEPAREILRSAVKNRVDLIIMGSHRVDPGRRRRGWGTTSYKVGILCRCPVMLVK